MRLDVGGDSYRVECEPEWPAGYVVRVTATPAGGYTRTISEDVYQSAAEGTAGFRKTAHAALDAWVQDLASVDLNPSKVVVIDDEE